jgi:hypothetical protein
VALGSECEGGRGLLVVGAARALLAVVEVEVNQAKPNSGVLKEEWDEAERVDELAAVAVNAGCCCGGNEFDKDSCDPKLGNETWRGRMMGADEEELTGAVGNMPSDEVVWVKVFVDGRDSAAPRDPLAFAAKDIGCEHIVMASVALVTERAAAVADNCTVSLLLSPFVSSGERPDDDGCTLLILS